MAESRFRNSGIATNLCDTRAILSPHFIAKVAIRTDTCDTSPPPPRDSMWSTHATPEEALEVEKLVMEEEG